MECIFHVEFKISIFQFPGVKVSENERNLCAFYLVASGVDTEKQKQKKNKTKNRKEIEKTKRKI